MRHDLMVEAQYPQAPTSTAKKCRDQPIDLIAEQSGSYYPNLVACHDSMFSSQGQVTSRIITVFLNVEQRRISSLSCEIVIVAQITTVDSRSDKRTQSGTGCSNPQLFFFKEVFGSLEPALTYFPYENLVVETWYDIKKLFIDDTRTRNTTS